MKSNIKNNNFIYKFILFSDLKSSIKLIKPVMDLNIETLSFKRLDI